MAAAFGWTGLSLLGVPSAQACPEPLPKHVGCDGGDWLDGGRLSVEGYCMQRSYAPGERVVLCLSARRAIPITVTVQRLGRTGETVWSGSARAEPKTIPPSASEEGCKWNRESTGDLSFEIPATWKPGFYRLTMAASSGQDRSRDGEAFFVVRSAAAGKTSRILLVLSSNTYCAYNNYGARRASKDSTHGGFYEQATYASFHRPLPRGFLSPYHCVVGDATSRQHLYAGWDKWEWPFVQWAEREGIALDYAANEDLERFPDLLGHYRLILSVGHDEYWSAGMRQAFDRYVRAGGNVAFFSGNVCYRQVRLDLPSSRLSLPGEMDGDALWSHRSGPNDPENRLTGVSFCYGALNPEPIPYTIYRPRHWLFEGLWGSGKITQFPRVGCIGYECDGCDIEWKGGIPLATGRDGTPENFEILGLAGGRMPDYEATVHSKALFGRDDGFTPWGRNLRQGIAVLGLRTDGGTIVTVGCTEWAKHLGDPQVAQITRNILTRLSV